MENRVCSTIIHNANTFQSNYITLKSKALQEEQVSPPTCLWIESKSSLFTKVVLLIFLILGLFSPFLIKCRTEWNRKQNTWILLLLWFCKELISDTLWKGLLWFNAVQWSLFRKPSDIEYTLSTTMLLDNQLL